jgi:hypothetical protein
MKTLPKYLLRCLIYVAGIIVSFASSSYGGVFISDQITTLNTDVYLKVQTRGRFFSEGGKLVDIYVDNKKIKRILTGGDGYGYQRYTPQRTGMVPMEARAEGHRDTGILLVVDKDDKVILIEIESALKESPLSDRPRRDSRHIVTDLAKEYKIVYLNNLLGAILFEGWLKKEKFPESAVLKWQGANTLKRLTGRGIKLHAIIGSANTISAAKKHIQNRYSFEETKDGHMVKDWEEIMELIREESTRPDRPSEKEQN